MPQQWNSLKLNMCVATACERCLGPWLLELAWQKRQTKGKEKGNMNKITRLSFEHEAAVRASRKPLLSCPV